MPAFSNGYATPDATQKWWCSGQPNFLVSNNVPKIQACGTVDLSRTGGVCMNDRWCWETLPFICKKS